MGLDPTQAFAAPFLHLEMLRSDPIVLDHRHSVSSGSGDSQAVANAPSEAQGAHNDHGERLSRLSSSANFKNRAAQKRYRERQKGKMETYKQQVDELSQRLSQLQAENESLETRNRLLEKVVQMKDSKPPSAAAQPEQEGADQNGPWPGVDTHAALAEYVNAVRRQREPLVLPQDAARISPEDLRQIRMDYIKEMGVLMLASSNGSSPDGHRQLEDYVLSTRLAVINLLNSMSVRAFAHILGLKKRVMLANHISERVMTVMKLSPDQKRDLIAARHGLLERNEQIKEKRSKILADLQEAVPSMSAVMCGQTTAMLRACDSSDQFKASLEEEHRSIAQFHIDCVQVLTPIQEARALLEAHPGNPDHWLISGYLEAEQQGNLAAWLREHSLDASGTSTCYADPAEASAESQPPTSSASGFLAKDTQLGLNDIPDVGNVPLQQDGNVPLELLSPLQGMPSLPELMPLAPGATMSQDLDAALGDDMWLDMFPGLLTQAHT